MKEINSTTNFRVLQWIKLKDKENRNAKKMFIVEGYHSVLEAYKTNYLKEVITTENTCEFDVPTYKVRNDVMKKLSSLATPHKIIGICEQKNESNYGNSNWNKIDDHYFSVSERYFHPFEKISAASKEEFKKIDNYFKMPYIFKPDIIVNETKEDYINGIDTILNSALDYCKSKNISK